MKKFGKVLKASLFGIVTLPAFGIGLLVALIIRTIGRLIGYDEAVDTLFNAKMDEISYFYTEIASTINA